MTSEENKQEIRIVIVDRSRMASQLLAEVLSRSQRFRVTAAGSPNELPELVRGMDPQIAIISADLQLGPTKGVEVARELRKSCPGIRIILLADVSTRELVIEAFRAGARGVFCRTEPVS